MKFTKRITGFLILALVLGLAGAGIYYRISRGGEGEAAGEPGSAGDVSPPDSGSSLDADMPIPVEGAKVVRDTLVLSVSAAGQAASFRSTVLRAQVSGQVRAVHVRENAGVGTGQVLLEIDSTDYVLNLREA